MQCEVLGDVCSSYSHPISSIVDRSSGGYRGRAITVVFSDNASMNQEGWKIRLRDIAEGSGLSMRAISLAAGKSPGYMHSILTEGKDPTIDNLVRVCDVLHVSLSYVLYGVEITADAEEILARLQHNPQLHDAILQILRAQAA